MSSEILFSYGTLQLESVQVATFGRTLVGEADALTRFAASPLEIDDPEVIAISGKAVHTMGHFTGNEDDVLEGMRLEVTREELIAADGYEVPAVKRVKLTLRSGVAAWVYVDARFDESLA